MTTRPDKGTASSRYRLLFFAESATLAHVARPLALAMALDPRRYEVHLACPASYRRWLHGSAVIWHQLECRSSEDFARALARGKPIYDTETLRAYVQQDLHLLQRVAPQLVVGDLRLSLSVSARLLGVPYVNITNAYWSPYGRASFPVPELPMTRLLGPWWGQLAFNALRKPIFALHTLPLNRVCRQYGLPGLGADLLDLYADGDHVLYADLPAVAPILGQPAHHHHIGPVLWSPPIDLPGWWSDLRTDRPLVYVCLGSSGPHRLLSKILWALETLPVTVVVATAGRASAGLETANAMIAGYLPGEVVAKRSALLIGSGGNLTAYQALAAGVPMLGLPSNLDQYLSMSGLRRAGAGMLLRSGTATVARIRSAALALLNQVELRRPAHLLQQSLARWDGRRRFAAFVERTLPAPPAAPRASMQDGPWRRPLP